MVSTYAIAALLLNPELQTKQLKQHAREFADTFCKAISDPGHLDACHEAQERFEAACELARWGETLEPFS